MNKGTSQYPRCVLITFVLVIWCYLCFQLFSGLLCTIWIGSALGTVSCIHVGTSGAVQWWVQVSEGRNCWKRYRRTNKFPMNIWRWVSLLNVGFMILWYSRNWNPEIWKFPEEKKSLHSLNSAIKELVYSFFNFDSEETSRISDKKDTDHATKKKTHQNGSNDSIVANGIKRVSGPAMTGLLKVELKLLLSVLTVMETFMCSPRFMGRKWLVRDALDHFRSQFFSQSLMKLYEI